MLAGNKLEKGRFTGPVAAHNTDNGTGRNRERQVLIKQFVIESLGDIMKFNDFIAKAWARRNINLIGFITLLEIARLHFFKAVEACLAFRLATLGITTHPLKLMLNGFLARGFLLGFLVQALVFLLQPLGVITFKWNTLTAV